MTMITINIDTSDPQSIADARRVITALDTGSEAAQAPNELHDLAKKAADQLVHKQVDEQAKGKPHLPFVHNFIDRLSEEDPSIRALGGRADKMIRQRRDGESGLTYINPGSAWCVIRLQELPKWSKLATIRNVSEAEKYRVVIYLTSQEAVDEAVRLAMTVPRGW